MTEIKQAPWDVFIVFAAEDKAELVEPLAHLLMRFGVKVQYAEHVVRRGDDLRANLDRGFAQAPCGLVVLSNDFAAKNWSEDELRGLSDRGVDFKRVVYPIWFKVTGETLSALAPRVAGRAQIIADTSKLVKTAVDVIRLVRQDIYRRISLRITVDESRGATMDPRTLNLSAIKHPELPDDLVSRVRLIRASLLDVHPYSMDRWLDGFQRDANPATEIGYWERIASAYLEYVSMTPRLAYEQYEQAFELSLAFMLTNDKQELRWTARDLPEGAFEVMSRLHAHKMPAYDTAENFDQGPGPIATYFGDIESFPEDLIGELVRIKKVEKEAWMAKDTAPR